MAYASELSQEFLKRIVLSDRNLYEIGQEVSISGADMSRLLRKYPGRWSDETWKKTICRVGAIVGLEPKQCFSGKGINYERKI